MKWSEQRQSTTSGPRRPEFWRLAVNWSNLYVACGHCNDFKLEKWDPMLIAPDEADFRFGRYFSFESDTGRIEPNPAASPGDMARAEATIGIFGFNQGSKPQPRKFNGVHIPIYSLERSAISLQPSAGAAARQSFV